MEEKANIRWNKVLCYVLAKLIPAPDALVKRTAMRENITNMNTQMSPDTWMTAHYGYDGSSS